MKFWRKLHKWMGLLVAVQILLWISGGVVMTVIPIDKVRGQHLVEKPPQLHGQIPLHLDISHYQQTQWFNRLGQPVLKLTDKQGALHYLDAKGQPLSDITAEQAQQWAVRWYRGEGQAVKVTLLQQMPHEAGGLTAPFYRVDFDDWINSSFYIDPVSANIRTVRSDLWRVFDFFWMLHILDFEEREDFNNPLVISLAIAAWLFTLTGFILLYHSWLKPNWKKWRYQREARA